MPERCTRAAASDQHVPWRIRQFHAGGGGILAVIDHAGIARRGTGLEEHQPEPGIVNPLDPAGIDAVAARLAVDDAAERPGGQARHPRHPPPEPGQDAADIEFAAADAGLEQPRLVEALHPGRRQAQ